MQILFLLVAIKRYDASTENSLVSQQGSGTFQHIYHASSHSDTTLKLSLLKSKDMGICDKQFALNGNC
jgi:hypothetical protein